MNEKPTVPRTSRSDRRWVALVLGIVLLALVNLVVLPPIWANGPNNSIFVFSWFVGGLFGEVFLLATWAALGPQSTLQRTTATYGLTALAISAFAWSLDKWTPEIPATIAMDVTILLSATFVSIQLPLWIYRIRRRRFLWAVDPGTAPVDHKNQFAIRDMIMSTSLVAIVIVVIQNTQLDGPVGLEMLLVDLVFFTAFIAVGGLFCLPAALFCFSEDNVVRSRAFNAVVIVAMAGPLGLVVLVELLWGSAGGGMMELVQMFFGCSFGLTLTVVSVFGICRRLGFRLVTLPADPESRSSDQPHFSESD